MNKAAILVAGGKGTRMGTARSKQFLEIGGLPVLMHTIKAFLQAERKLDLILVLPQDQFLLWEELCQEFRFDRPHRIVAGGASRFQSVKNGLNAVNFDRGVVAIHDGVRPFVSKKVIQESFRIAEAQGSAIPVISLKDSIRKVSSDGGSEFQDRQVFRLVQTPQTFQLEKIKQAFLTPESDQFTDDATVYEAMGWQVTLFEGNPENIKITTPEDLEYGDFLFHRQQKDSED